MDNIKQHFETEAKEFDEIIVKLIPYYHQMIEALIESIPFDTDSALRVLDLGSGTGTIAKKISEKYPNSSITCLDIASNMINIAKHKLSEHKNAEFILGDFSKIANNMKYDVIVSSLALHHLENDTKKKNFYTTIYGSLKEDGVFYNADVVLASTDYIQSVNMHRWIDYMNKSVHIDEIETKWLPTYKAEDRPAKLVDQLNWLQNIGFKAVDVIWKYYNFCVYGGSK